MVYRTRAADLGRHVTHHSSHAPIIMNKGALRVPVPGAPRVLMLWVLWLPDSDARRVCDENSRQRPERPVMLA